MAQLLGGGILAYTNANVDQLELLTRAVRDNTVEQYKQRAPGDVIVATSWSQTGLFEGSYSGAIIDNDLYMWGTNDKGQLGLGDWNPRTSPTLVEKISDGTTEMDITGTITQIALGAQFSGVVIDGKLYMWGDNTSNQLGLGGNSAIIPTLVKNVSDAGVVSNLTGNISKISFGVEHSAAIINDKLYTWGSDAQLGLGINQLSANIPTLVENIEVTEGAPITPIIDAVTQVSLGLYYSAAVIGGKLYTWGSGGRLGIDGASWKVYRPTLVPEISDGTNPPVSLTGTVNQISLGYMSGGAVIDNKLYTWGVNTSGELGLGTSFRQVAIPTLVKNAQVGNNTPNPITSNITDIYIGSSHASAIIGGELYTWGSNKSGELGLGNFGAIKYIPTLVENISDGINPPVSLTGTVTQISVGYNRTAAVIDKKVYTWGNNVDGQLGLGDNTNRSIPTEVNFIIQKEITLNQNNDPNGIRNDIVYNIPETKLKTLINSLKNEIGIPASDTLYNISPNRKNIGTFDATTTGQITLVIKSLPSDTDFKVKFNGFLPVNLTKNVRIPPKALPTADKTYFANDEINQLVEDAKNGGVNSKLAKWIRDNQLLFIGDTSAKYTDDFPKDAKITKISNFRVVDGTKGEIRFNIEVDKYYKEATPATDLIESTITDPALLMTNPITLSGFNATRESAISVIPTSDRNFTAKELLDSFGFANETTAITTNGLVELKKYLTDLNNFPTNTSFKINSLDLNVYPQPKNATLSFFIVVDKYFDNSGIQVNQPKTFNAAKLEIDGLKDSTSSISRNTTQAPNTIDAATLLKSFGYVDDNTNITTAGKTELEKYLDFSNFPGNTEFKITDVDKSGGTTLKFKVSANRSTDASGTETTADKVFPGTGTFEIKGLKDSSTKQPALISPTSQKTPDAILKEMGYAQINTTSGSVTKAGLEQYFTNIDTFPPTATYELRNLVITTTTLTFKIYANIYCDAAGTEIPDFTSIKDYTITGVLNASTTVSVVIGHNTNILSGDLWKSFKVQQDGSWNEALTAPYFLIQDKAQGATFTMQKLAHSAGNLSLRITASSHIENGIVVSQPKPYDIQINGLISAKNSIDVKFQKDIISGDGASISQQIETQLIVGNTINSNNPLLQEIANTAAYPPNTTFTIDAVTPVDKVIFKTFSIDLSADQFYQDQTTMIGAHPRTIDIDNLKFSPTKWSRMARVLPDIKNEQFITYVNYDDVNGTFDHVKLQEFFILESFDLTTPNATRMTNVRIVNDEIKFELVVTHYVDQNGIGQNAPFTYDLSIDLNNSVGVLPGTGTGTDTTDKSTETMILATSIAGGVFLLFLLLLLLLLLIRRKRHMADHYIKISGNNSGNNVNHDSQIDEDDGEYDQFWKDESDWTESSSKKA